MAAPTIRRILLVRLLTATVAVLAVLAAGLGALAYLAFLRPPQTSPAEFLARPPAERAAQVVVAAGSSTTRATLSADWVGAVRARAGADTEIVNAGANGDTAAGLLARLDDDVIATAPAAVVVLIGGNDLRAGVPVTEYSSTLTAIVQRLQDRTTARVALLSLPPAGEEPAAATNAEVERYNRAIADVAARTGSSYLPLYEQLLPLLAPGLNDPGDLGLAGMLAVAFQHYALGRSWDQIAESSGRWLLTDGIHLTDRAGAAVTDIVTEWLETQPAPN